MERGIVTQKLSKFSVDIKQNAKGVWYIGSLRVNADTIEELDNLVDSTLEKLRERIERLNRKESPAGRPLPHPVLDANDQKLFTFLKEVRTGIARKENVPPYVILHDAALKHIAKQRPKTQEDMLKIEGMGGKRFKKYGELFIKGISNFEYSNK